MAISMANCSELTLRFGPSHLFLHPEVNSKEEINKKENRSNGDLVI